MSSLVLVGPGEQKELVRGPPGGRGGAADGAGVQEPVGRGVHAALAELAWLLVGRGVGCGLGGAGGADPPDLAQLVEMASLEAGMAEPPLARGLLLGAGVADLGEAVHLRVSGRAGGYLELAGEGGVVDVGEVAAEQAVLEGLQVLDDEVLAVLAPLHHVSVHVLLQQADVS